MIGQTLPINSFTIAEGLAHNNINRIFQDSKGYLWLATGEGLSRFDGNAFKTYDASDGLRGPYINDITADAKGRLWVAINEGGVARLLDGRDEQGENPGKKFISYSISEHPRAKNVGRIVFDAENRLWCATEAGIYRARSTEVVDGDFEFVGHEGDDTPVREALVDSRGRLWFGLRDRMLMIDDGRLIYFDLDPPSLVFVTGIVEGGGRLLASTPAGVYEFSEAESRWQRIPISLQDDQVIETIHSSPDDGSLWIGTSAGVIRLRNGEQVLFSKESGLTSNVVTAVFTDRENGLWFGTYGGGLNNRPNNAVVRYSGPQLSKPHRFSEGDDGTIYLQAGCNTEPVRLLKIGESEIEVVPFPEVRTEGGCRRNYFLRSSDGRQWIMSKAGELSVFASGVTSPMIPVKLPGGKTVVRYLEVYDDRTGKVWLSASDRNLYVADLQDPSIRFELAAENIGASMILRDSRGIVWLANNVFLGRYRDGVVDEIKAPDGSENVGARSMFEDRNGRIWIGTRHMGVLYTDDPASPAPTFKSVTTSDGLPSNAVWAIASDDIGGMYFGTGRGVARYDPSSGLMRYFTSADGVSESIVNYLFKDSNGRIWVASDSGVSRIDPAALHRDLRPTPVYINHIAVEGEELPIDETGVLEFTSGDLAASQNNVTIRFVGLSLNGERALSYRYKLEGSDKDWSPAVKQREVNLVNLGPGSYRFLVKAITPQGVESEHPAVVQFNILAPIWQRWWFVGLVIAGVAAMFYALYRYRVSRVVELERVRTRIATDLHDDIGANLTRIALMSEVLNQEGSNGSAATMLPSIANIARESVASMNDIVWAISPDHDRVLDLTRRMRQHAEEVFTIRDIDVKFVSQSSDTELKLPVGVRRDVLLIFKEAVNNSARHSGCTRVEIVFECSNARLRLHVADNGRGFEEQSERDGHGLSSMTRRAESLGGRFEIRSSPGDGTSVNFEMRFR